MTDTFTLNAGEHDQVDLTDSELEAWMQITEQVEAEPLFLPWLWEEHRPVFDRYSRVCRVLHRARRVEAWRAGAARPEQLLPGTPGSFSNRTDWRVWLMMAGRGSGKSRAAAEALREMILGRSWKHEQPRFALVSTTLEAVRVDMVEGQLLDVLGADIRQYNRSTVEIWLHNGCYLKGYGSDNPRRLRGPNFHGAWADEPAAWTDADKAPSEDSTWSNLDFAVRKDDGELWVPRIIASTTPRPCKLLRVADETSEHYPGLADDPDVVTSTMRTIDNADNLAEIYKKRTLGRYAGTRLGAQELDGKLLDAAEGALWDADMIAACQVNMHDLTGPAGGQGLTVVSVDPSIGDGSGDECGIIAGCVDVYRANVWTLGDFTVRGKPKVWAVAVKKAFDESGADYVVGEANQGGEMVRDVLATRYPNMPVRLTWSKRGKEARAEPIAILTDQGRTKFVDRFPLLEGELCTWEPGKGKESPNRLDAFVGMVMELLPAEAERDDSVSDYGDAFEDTR